MRIRVFDLETTGLTPDEHAPCEIGYADLVAARRDLAGEPCGWRIEGPTSRLCDPGRNIPPESSAIHHIVDAAVAGAMPWRELLIYVAPPAASAARLYAAHNAAFERRWITDDLTDGAEWICTYKCALRLWPDAPGHANQTLRYWLLLDADPDVDLSAHAMAHRAGPDALVTAQILRRMLEIPGVSLDQLIAWTHEPALLVKCNIGAWRGRRWAEIDSPGFLSWILDRDFSDDVRHTARHHLNRLRAEAAQEGADA